MSRRRLAVRAALLSALALGLTLGGTSPVLAAPSVSQGAASAEAPPTVGTVDGKLVDESGNPLGGIRAELFLPEASGPMDAPVAHAISAYSAQEYEHLDPGFYRFRDVEPGEYVLRFVDDYGNYASTDYSGPVTVTAGSQQLQDTVIAVAPDNPRATLTGVVLGKDGAPAADAWVELYRVVRGTHSRHLDSVFADENGQALFRNVPTGVALTVCAYGDGGRFCQGGAVDPVEATTFTIEPTASTHDFGTLQHRPRLVTGVAVDRGGLPVTSGYVTLYQHAGDITYYRGQADLATDGSFAVTGALPGGSHVVCVTRTESVVDPDAPAANLNYHLGEYCQGGSDPFYGGNDFVFPATGESFDVDDVADPQVILRGRAVDSEGITLRDAGLSIREIDGDIADYLDWTQTRADGTFAMRMEPRDGDLTLCLEGPRLECLGGASDPLAADTFQVPVDGQQGTVVVEDLVVDRRVHIRGTLTRVGASLPMNHTIIAYGKAENGSLTTRGYKHGTDSEGGFDLAIPYTQDLVTVCVQLRSRNVCAGGGDVDAADFFELPADGSAYTLDSPIALPAGTVVEGRVLTRGGGAVADSFVQVYELVDGDSDGDLDYANSWGSYDFTDSGGEFSILTDLGGEDITVCAQHGGGRYQVVCLGGVSDPLLADTVTAPPAGQTLTLPDLTLRYTPNYCDDRRISNGTVALGVSCEGEVNGYGDEGQTGLVLEGVGQDDDPYYHDGLIQGCACEGWGVADTVSGVSGFANRNNAGTAGLELVDFVADEDSATSIVEIDEKLLVTHDYQPSPESDYAYDVNVEVENLTEDAMDLAYRRVMDWDVYPTAFNELISMHTGGDDVAELTFASNDGFASADALAGPSDRGATGDFDRFGPKDQGSLMDFDFGDLAGESTRGLHFVYGVAPSRSEALLALDDENAVAWTLAQPSSIDDLAEGSPNTFFFGYVASDAPSNGPAGTNVEAPGLTGTPQVGQTLTATSGTWNPSSGLEFSYRWLRGGDTITGATNATYVLKQADVGTNVRVQVTARRDGFSPVRALSSAVQVQGLPTLEVTTPPAIAVQGGGQPEVGKVLQVTPGQWTGADDIAYSYEWRAAYGDQDDSFSLGAGGPQFTVPSYLAGYRVFVVETASSGSATSDHASSNQLSIYRAPQLRPDPRTSVSGSPRVGEQLSLAPGSWLSDEGDSPVAAEVSYAWFAGGTQVSDEATYTPTSSDLGRYLYVEVKATADGYLDGYDFVDVGPVRTDNEVIEQVTVQVVKAGSSPLAGVPGVYVMACSIECLNGDTTGQDGRVALDLPVVGQDYTFYAYPSSGFNNATTTSPVPVGGDGIVTIAVEAPVPTPPNVTTDDLGTRDVDSDGDGVNDGTIPVGVIGQPATVTLQGCPGVTAPTWSVEFASGAQPMTGSFTEVNGTYTAEIPPFTSTGTATFSTNVPAVCDEAPTEFTIYIDPAGVVTDQFGRPINGAQVTLLKEVGGAYVAVANGDTSVMDPGVNTANPSVTLADGAFRWDVTAGHYKVELSSGASGGATCATTTTNPLEVPPPRLDLLLKATCAGATRPTPTTAPAVSGTRQVGQTLSVSTGVWADGIVQKSVQWLRDGAEIVGATGATYQQVEADLGKVITARVTAQRPDYRQENGSGEVVAFASFGLTTTGTATAAAGGGGGGGTGTALAPTATTPPSVTGTARVGSTLTANPGTWDTAGLSFAYQWLRGSTVITGATGATYAATVDDLDQPVSVRVTASKTGVPDGTSTSPTVTIAKGAAPSPLSPPLVTGEAAVGELLSVSNGAWDTDNLSFDHQWLRDGDAIAGATGSTYTVTEADQGSALSVAVTASRPGYDSGRTVTGAVSVPSAPDPEPEEPVGPRGTRTTARFADNTITQRQRALLRVVVRGVTPVEGQVAGRPTGRVVIKVDGVAVERMTLNGASDRVSVRLGRLKTGKHRVRVIFLGNPDFSRSSSKVLVLKVRKAK